MERLRGMDAAFLYMETHATPMHIAFIAVLDAAAVPGGLDRERIRSHVARRSLLVEPFRRTLRASPLGLHHPRWVDTGPPDVDQHLDFRVVEDRSPHALERSVGKLLGEHLDRSRPLWHLTVLEGPDPDRPVLVLRVHHATMDGVGGIEHLHALFDLAPEADDPEPGDTAVGRDAGERGGVGVDAGGGDDDLVATLVDRVRSLAGVVPLLGRTAGAVSDVALGRASTDGPVGGTPLRVPSVPFTGAVTAGRSAGFASLDLGALERLRAGAGLTMNEALLAVSARALRHHLVDQGALPDQPLMASCPVSVRSTDDRLSYGNRLSVMFTRLHTELEDPVDCLEATRRSARAARTEHRQLGSGLLADWAEVADGTVLAASVQVISRTRLADLVPPPHNLVLSTIPGPPVPVYFAGARVTHAYPMGAVFEGSGLAVTMLTYADHVDIGVNAASGLLAEPWALADRFAPALDELG